MIPRMDLLPLLTWSDKYLVDMSALTGYYDALCEHIRLVEVYGNKFGVSKRQLSKHDDSKWTKKEFPFYADRFHGKKIHNSRFISALNHHYINNMHHPECWITSAGYIYPMEREYVIEMLADWHAASYQYTGSDNIQTWLDEKLDLKKFHPTTLLLLKKELADIGYLLKEVV